MANKEELELVVGEQIKSKKELMLHRVGVAAFLIFVIYNIAVKMGWMESLF